ncbi:MAG: helix-turn-helix transcriptional regulator [Bacteroidia bacterium]|nr:helix-turn-helix transcriptional regulator [Bacteroidia bacterium]
MNIEEIAIVIRKKRDLLNITQQDLATRSGVHLRSINNLEGGKGNPSLDTLLKIAEVLKLELIVRTPH